MSSEAINSTMKLSHLPIPALSIALSLARSLAPSLALSLPRSLAPSLSPSLMHSLLAPPPLPAQTYKYWPTAEADVRECLAADPYDACDFPQYCRDDAAQCRLWPDNRNTMAYPQPCPHLDGPDMRFEKNFSCWDHANYPGGLARGSSSVTSQSVSVAKAATMNEEAPLNGSAAQQQRTPRTSAVHMIKTWGKGLCVRA